MILTFFSMEKPTQIRQISKEKIIQIAIFWDCGFFLIKKK
jgi:hypothetical protein